MSVVPLVAVAPAVAQAADQTGPPGAASQGYGSNVTIVGHGFGHGEGMGQWGAYGYATKYGWSWQAILANYYGGTSLAGIDPNQPISVRLQALDDRPFTAFVQDRGLLATNADGAVNRYRSIVTLETGPGVYNVYGRTDATVCPSAAAPFDPTGWATIAAGRPSSVASGQYLDIGVPGVDPNTPDATSLTGVCQPDGAVIYYRGTLRAVNGSAGENRTVNVLPLDFYVRAVVPREMPASWGTSAGGAGMNALRVQAVAARSFALAGGIRWPYARICDTQSCQVYGGVARRASVGATLQPLEAPTATAATAETVGLVMVRSGAIVSAMYSSSTGGITAGVLFPSVVDVGDEVSPHRTWSTSVSVATIEAKWPAVGRLLSIEVTRRNGKGDWGGRVLELYLRGSAGSLKLTGDQLRIGLGLKSNWFNVPAGCTDQVGGTPTPTPSPGTFTAVTPSRVVDTRTGLNAPGRLGAACVLAVRLAGLGGIPATGATAAAVNVTVVTPSGSGYATVYPCSVGRPLASSLNFAAAAVVPNLVTVPLDGDGFVCFYATTATDVLIDVMGWYGGTTGDLFRAAGPSRLVDTRQEAGGAGALAAGGVLRVPVVGGAGAPAGTSVRAAALNITVTRPLGAGYLSVYPCESGPPATSNANFTWARTVANQVVVAVGASAQVCVLSSAETDLIVDLLGWYGPTGGARFTPVPPSRALDTRNAVGVPGGAPLGAGGRIELALAGSGPVAAGATAVALNVTSTSTAADGYVTVYPCGPVPGASNLNPIRGLDVANHVMVPLGPGGRVCLTTSSSTHLVADVAGFFTA